MHHSLRQKTDEPTQILQPLRELNLLVIIIGLALLYGVACRAYVAIDAQALTKANQWALTHRYGAGDASAVEVA